MLADKWVAGAVDVLLAFLAVYLFFQYFSIFFQRKEGNFRALLGIIVLIVWQLDVSNIIHMLSAAWNICVTMGITLFAVTSILDEVFFLCYIRRCLDAGRDVNWRSADDLWREHHRTADFWLLCLKAVSFYSNYCIKEGIYE